MVNLVDLSITKDCIHVKYFHQVINIYTYYFCLQRVFSLLISSYDLLIANKNIDLWMLW